MSNPRKLTTGQHNPSTCLQDNRRMEIQLTSLTDYQWNALEVSVYIVHQSGVWQGRYLPKGNGRCPSCTTKGAPASCRLTGDYISPGERWLSYTAFCIPGEIYSSIQCTRVICLPWRDMLSKSTRVGRQGFTSRRKVPFT